MLVYPGEVAALSLVIICNQITD